MTPEYLVRFDDICPTMDWRKWDQVERILIDAGIKPLLGVVPDNCDPELRAGPAEPAFWQKVRGWRDLGWSIGLHGYQHCYVSASAGILGRNRYSEFSGLPESVQRAKLERAIEIFRREDVVPEVWIAPGHSFDETTVRVLASLGVDSISDGYTIFPYVCREGVLWIPQQMGSFRKMPFGTWTVCLHVNPWIPRQIDRFRDDVSAFKELTVSLPDIQRTYRNRTKTLSDQFFFNCVRTIRSLKA